MTKSAGNAPQNKQKGKGKKGKGQHNDTRHNDRNNDGHRDRYNDAKDSKKGSFKKLPLPLPASSTTTIQPVQAPRVPGIKDYVDMVMTDLSTRPPLWHFSSYGLTLSPTQSLPFPHLGTTELSAEELRLQVYAEAAATGGRIDNYCRVVQGIKERAEMATKLLIPDLERVVTETLRANHIPTGNIADNPANLNQHQESLKQALLQRGNVTANIYQQAQSAPVYTQGITHATQGNIHANNHANTHAQSASQHPPYTYQQIQVQNPNSIIPDDSFAFGLIPEIPPE